MICPHLIDQMSAFCRCALDPERDHCGIYSELCHGNGWPCFADLGPWGAWRAVLDQLVPLLAKMDRPFVIDETTTDEQMEAWYDTRLMWSERLLALGRLGWTP